MKRLAAALALATLAPPAATAKPRPPAAAQLEARYNRLRQPPPYPATPAARAFTRAHPVADLHADTLMWRRDPLTRAATGHVDLPRLIDGGVALQVFGVVTRVPPKLRMKGNTAGGDRMAALYRRVGDRAMADADPTGRALLQARALSDAAAASDGRLRLVTDRATLDAVLAARAAADPDGPRPIAALLGLEGGQAVLEAGAVDALYAAGFRMLAPVHFYDNALGGSAHGESGRGLTPLGALVIARAQARGMVIDLAHASPALFADVVGRTPYPVIVSHTGVAGTCPSTRNLDDAQLRALAATGGVVGIGYWEAATCGRDVAAIVRAIQHATSVVGVDHVALGSDFDGATAMPFDATGVPGLIDGLRGAGYDDEALAKIAGGNVVRVLRQTLPR